MTNPNQEKNQSPEITIPELTQLTTLQSSVAENNLQSLSNLNTLKDNIANSVISLDVNQIEEISTAFV